MVISSSTVGKPMRKAGFGDNACGAHGHFAAGRSLLFEAGEAVSETMAYRRQHSLLCRKHRSSFKLRTSWKFALLVGFLVVLFFGANANAKGGLVRMSEYLSSLNI